MATHTAHTLAGRHVVVTRPEAQADALARSIAEEGGLPVRFPVLAISDVEDTAPVLAAAERLEDYDFAVFVSANAIEKALSLILPHRSWPEGLPVAVMGKSSERAVARFGIREIVSPQERFDSEALLALPPFQVVAGKKVIVFRGDAGRELLGDTLQARGATVEYVTCYRRSRPELDAKPLMELWGKGELDAVTLSSSEGLRNLWAMLDEAGRAYLAQTPVFVPHRRIAEEAQRLGLLRVIPTGPGDDGLMAGLNEFFDTERMEASAGA
ncbi:MAG: uroporphyrinogen-III synthase [Rhodocyclaceae bacterium]|nr:uroporphyrinogen-III synthase [Rhodocyclaceae bacterium]